MTVRNRLVNFRVTDEELRRLKTASALQSARGLSDFARTIILDSVKGFSRSTLSGDSGSGELASFDRRLARIEAAVARLEDAFENSARVAITSER